MFKTTGRTMLVVAELEAICDTADVIRQSAMRTRGAGRTERGLS